MYLNKYEGMGWKASIITYPNTKSATLQFCNAMQCNFATLQGINRQLSQSSLVTITVQCIITLILCYNC